MPGVRILCGQQLSGVLPLCGPRKSAADRLPFRMCQWNRVRYRPNHLRSSVGRWPTRMPRTLQRGVRQRRLQQQQRAVDCPGRADTEWTGTGSGTNRRGSKGHNWPVQGRRIPTRSGGLQELLPVCFWRQQRIPEVQVLVQRRNGLGWENQRLQPQMGRAQLQHSVGRLFLADELHRVPIDGWTVAVFQFQLHQHGQFAESEFAQPTGFVCQSE